MSGVSAPNINYLDYNSLPIIIPVSFKETYGLFLYECGWDSSS